MGYRANSGRGHPRQTEQSTGATESHDEQQIQMETRTLDQHSLFLTDYQPRRRESISNTAMILCSINQGEKFVYVYELHYSYTITSFLKN